MTPPTKILEVWPDDGFWRARTTDGRVSAVAQSLDEVLRRVKADCNYLPAEEQGDYVLVLKFDTD